MPGGAGSPVTCLVTLARHATRVDQRGSACSCSRRRRERTSAGIGRGIMASTTALPACSPRFQRSREALRSTRRVRSARTGRVCTIAVVGPQGRSALRVGPAVCSATDCAVRLRRSDHHVGRSRLCKRERLEVDVRGALASPSSAGRRSGRRAMEFRIAVGPIPSPTRSRRSELEDSSPRGPDASSAVRTPAVCSDDAVRAYLRPGDRFGRRSAEWTVSRAGRPPPRRCGTSCRRTSAASGPTAARGSRRTSRHRRRSAPGPGRTPCRRPSAPSSAR